MEFTKLIKVSKSANPGLCLVHLTKRDDDRQMTIEHRCEKTGLRGFRPGPIQTGLYSHIR